MVSYNEMKKKRFYIITMGCQMNAYDSEQMERLLMAMDYLPASCPEKADLILLNTCSIRQKPAHKVFSHLGRLARMKQKRPGMIIGVGGCVAQQEKRRLLKRAPHVDIVFGTSAIGRLQTLVRNVEESRAQMVDVEGASTPEPPVIKPSPTRKKRATAFVTIMSGCDNFCAYCVVPYVRGREVSRKPDNILAEIEYLVASGVREVTLLGQNVNSYGSKNGHGIDFSEFLEATDKVKGLKRIRFTTSHPKDLSERLVGAFARLEKLAPHIHLPVQCGSDRILKKMNRGYNKNLYLRKIEALRDVRPQIGITTDIIVGFPGETREDFEKTLDLVKSVGFDNLFAFKYSDRPDVPAAKFSEKVDEVEKKERLAEVLEIQTKITFDKYKSLVGTCQEVLVEGLSKKGDDQLTGHTPCNKIVNFVDDRVRIGQVVPVKIVEAFSHSLLGEPKERCGESPRKKRGLLHAA
jgi:tRNA-2-methylthio-N6-dimethylallyladenosine synthase